jgi:hypothetical protein
MNATFRRATFKRLAQLAVAALPTLFVTTAHAALVIDYPDFSNTTGLTLNGAAAKVGNVLRVTPATFSQAGSVFSTNTVSLASSASFSTYFQFRFTNAGGACDGPNSCGADGLVFVVQTVSNNVGTGGGGIGYQGIPKSLGIEFDTWFNGGVDIDSNHVGIDLNGDINSVKSVTVAEADMNNGAIWNAWVDYNSATSQLEVRLTQLGTRPVAALLSYNVNLASVLGSTSAFVGFTSGTGAAFANHDVLTWKLEDSFKPITPQPVPEPGALVLLAAALLGVAGVRRRH